MPNKNIIKSVRALERGAGIEYDEETFLHLLAIERARAGRASRKLRLLLATLEPELGRPVSIPPTSAARLFEGLRRLLRDTDIIGWYRQGQVAGAVLGADDTSATEGAGSIEHRVAEGVRKRLPSRIAGSLRVRVTQHGPSRIAER
jgi:hypothetical protein